MSDAGTLKDHLEDVINECNDLLRRLEDANKAIRSLEAELDRLERLKSNGI
jgi:flagellar hook-associated protein FlgK